MRRLFVLLFTLLLSTVAQASLDRHFVIFIHGIGGHTTDFGYLDKALLNYHSKINDDRELVISKFAYDTGNDKKDVEIFTDELSVYLKDLMAKSGGLRENDKVSFIMHSQGGIIGMNFLFKSFSGQRNFYPEIARHMDSFITLSTPYGGTKIAYIVDKIKPEKGIKIPYLLDAFGKKQLQDMSYASDAVFNLRQRMVDPATRGIYQEIVDRVRVMNITGVVEKFNIIPLFAKVSYYESDFAVPVASSRFDFIYNSTPTGSYKKTSFIKPENYQIVDAFHFSIIPEKNVLNGIANTPDYCVEILPEDCKHPAYKLLAPFLMNEPKRRVIKRPLVSFGIDLHVKLNGKLADPKTLKVKLSEDPANDEGLELDRKGDFYGRVERWSDSSNYHFYSNGYFEDDYGASTAHVQITVTAPGFKTYTTNALVERGFGTYVNANLDELVSSQNRK